jgi:hypothetical protein
MELGDWFAFIGGNVAATAIHGYSVNRLIGMGVSRNIS